MAGTSYDVLGGAGTSYGAGAAAGEIYPSAATRKPTLPALLSGVFALRESTR